MSNTRLETLAALINRFSVWKPVVTPARLAAHREEQLTHVRGPVTTPRTVTLICAGNLPVSAWQALCRAALLGVEQVRIKLPTSPHASAIRDFAAELHRAGLIARIDCATELTPEWLTTSDAVIVYGADDTLATLRAQVPPDVPFAGYGHKLSLGVVCAGDISPDTAARAARDLVAHEQEGCLSPHAFYVIGDGVETFAGLLDAALAALPLTPLDATAAGRVYGFRRDALFRGSRVLGPADLRWTLLLEPAPALRASCLHRTVHVAAVSDLQELSRLLAPHARQVSTIGMSRVTPFPCGASRFCELGGMQSPELEWKQDGLEPLAVLFPRTSPAEG